MAIKAMRVSKTSAKVWFLHGPIESALMTSCQANEVRAIPLSTHVHGEDHDVELWINTTEWEDEEEDEPNPGAQQMLVVAELAKKGLSFTELEAFGPGDVLDTVPKILGVAVLTGPGGTDFPQENPMCVVSALMGNHEEMEFDDGSLN